ncbi:hypothetical protein EVAR_49058_1 [Eumeta japonica]|uniref:Uncharacterized protein n=1 Tax=Eumeta variegata TaxID=151549 RepID=A0A4C1Y2D0_EUMVA|nr:hypothetical protein EVAR_49058_1 [Eumeta japonica]
MAYPINVESKSRRGDISDRPLDPLNHRHPRHSPPRVNSMAQRRSPYKIHETPRSGREISGVFTERRRYEIVL